MLQVAAEEKDCWHLLDDAGRSDHQCVVLDRAKCVCFVRILPLRWVSLLQAFLRNHF